MTLEKGHSLVPGSFLGPDMPGTYPIEWGELIPPDFTPADLRDRQPIITFDPRLSRLYSSIDFNYELYAGALRRARMSEQDIRSNRVHFAFGENDVPTVLEKDKNANGLHFHEDYSDSKRIYKAGQQVVYDTFFRFYSDDDGTSRTIMHEAAHQRFHNQRLRLGETFREEDREEEEAAARAFAEQYAPDRPLVTAELRVDEYLDEETGTLHMVLVGGWNPEDMLVRSSVST